MGFDTPGDHYDRFMGRFSRALAPQLADVAELNAGMRVLDVGCGPGALTGELVSRLGADAVAAIDPSPSFVAACRERFPDVDVREGAAEELPWAEDEYDAALACLVVNFMRDPLRGVQEMARVTRPGGRVAACVWDVANGRHQMLELASRAIREVRPDVDPHPPKATHAPGGLAGLLEAAGTTVVLDGELTCEASYSGFEDFWEPITFGVGPLGEALSGLTAEERAAVEGYCRDRLPDGPFTLSATAWCAVGTV